VAPVGLDPLEEARVVSIVTQLKAHLTTGDGVADTGVLDLQTHFIDDPNS